MIASSLAPHLLVLCETWLNDRISNQEIQIPDYDICRCDRRDGRRGGGVCVYVSCGVRYEEIVPRIQMPNSIESVCLRICNSDTILMALYIPPNLSSNDYKVIADYLVDCFDEITGSLADSYLMIVGDLNQFPTRAIEDHLNLTQIVDSPTRGNSTLDKILLDTRLLHQHMNCSPSEDFSTNRSPLTNHSLVTICPTIGNSDHYSVFMKSMAFSAQACQIRKVYDYRASHLNNFKRKLADFPWTNFFEANLSLDEKCEIFHEVIEDARSVIPFSYVSITSKDKPWITPVLKSLINQRYLAFRNKNFHLYFHYKQKVKTEIFKAKKNWTNSKISSASGLWSVVKNTANKDNTHGLSGLLQSFDSPQEAVERISEKLRESFSPSPNRHLILSRLSDDNVFWSPVFDSPTIAHILLHLKPQKAAGSDDLPPRLLRDAAFELAESLTHMLSLSFDTRTVPQK